MSELDCRDHCCLFTETRTGQRTNGHCRCLDELVPEKRSAVRRIVINLRAQLADHVQLEDRYSRALDEIAAWQEATGLCVGGDPGGVTVDHMKKLIYMLEDIARAAAQFVDKPGIELPHCVELLQLKATLEPWQKIPEV